MYLELPEFRRCCCFLPVRHGIIAFGYLNLAVACLIIALESLMLSDRKNPDATKPLLSVFHGVGFVVQAWVVFLLYTVDIVFNMVLLVGAHKKHTRLLKIYGYYGIATCCASLILFIIMRFQMEDYNSTYITVYMTITETSLALTAMVFKVYLLLLIRSELLKLKRNSELRFSMKPEEGNPF